MKIYNADKTQVLTNPDLEKGYLSPDRLQVGMSEAVAEQGEHRIVGEPDEQGYVRQEYVMTVAPKQAEPIYENIQVYIPYSDEQLQNMRISEIKTRLTALSEDIVQDLAGEVVPNIDERKAEFVTLHNELRELIDLEPREVKE